MTATIAYQLSALRLQVHDLLRILGPQSAGDTFRGNPPFGDGPKKQIHGFDMAEVQRMIIENNFRRMDRDIVWVWDQQQKIAAATRDIEQRKRISGRMAWIQE